MDIIEKVGETLVATGKDVADKAKGFVEVNHLKVQLCSRQSEADKLYTEMGRIIYKHREDWRLADLTKQMEQLDTIQAEITRLQNEILQTKGVWKCVNCGAEIDRHATFCPNCGFAVEIPKEETAKETVEEIAGEIVEESEEV